MKARKSKQSKNTDKLLLTRVLSLESIFDRNYERIWGMVSFDFSTNDNDDKASKKPSWNKQMSEGLAENNAEMMNYIAPENISMIIRERLSYVDTRKSHKNILSSQTYFLDDEMAQSDESDIDSIFNNKKFGVSRKESAENLKEIAIWKQADDEDSARLEIDIVPFDCTFLGEKSKQAPPKSPKQSKGQSPKQLPKQSNRQPLKPQAADPNDDLLDLAAWGLTDEDDDAPTAIPSQAPDINIDISPAQEMAELHHQQPAQANIPQENINAQDATSSDIVSVDNLLKNIGYHEKQAESNHQDINEHANLQPNIDLPPANESNIPKSNNDESNNGNHNQQLQQVQNNLHITGKQSHHVQKQALKAQKRAEKQAEKQTRQTQKQAQKAEKDRLKAQKQARKTEKKIKKTRSIRDILKENSEKTTPLTADEIALQAEFGGMASIDDDSHHAENILDKINPSPVDSAPHYQQIQKTFDNNPLSSMDVPSANINLPQTPEYQQAAVSEIKNMLGTDKNTASSDSILNDFANLQQKMAEKMNKK